MKKYTLHVFDSRNTCAVKTFSADSVQDARDKARYIAVTIGNAWRGKYCLYEGSALGARWEEWENGKRVSWSVPNGIER